jgi:galactonate dehydratase
MKISDIKTYIIRNTWKKWVFIEIITDDGSRGFGEATVYSDQFGLINHLKEVKKSIVNEDPFRVNKIMNKWFISSFNRSRDMVNISLMSGFEAACFDLIGKHCGSTVYNLFGGPVNEKIKLYANGWYTDINEINDWGRNATKVINKGYKALKFDPFGSGSGFLDYDEYKKSMEIIKIVHDAVGDSTEMLIEGHGRFNRSMAMKIGKELEKYDNIGWFEEPVIPEDIEGLSVLAHTLKIPIAAGERFITKYDFVEPIKRGAINVAQPDVINTGGILETLKIGAMAESNNIAMAPHQAEGPLNTFITLNVDALLNNLKIQEIFDEFAYPEWINEIVNERPKIHDGYASLPKKPGIGIEITDKINNYIEMKAIMILIYFWMGGRKEDLNRLMQKM